MPDVSKGWKKNTGDKDSIHLLFVCIGTFKSSHFSSVCKMLCHYFSISVRPFHPTSMPFERDGNKPQVPKKFLETLTMVGWGHLTLALLSVYSKSLGNLSECYIHVVTFIPSLVIQSRSKRALLKRQLPKSHSEKLMNPTLTPLWLLHKT